MITNNKIDLPNEINEYLCELYTYSASHMELCIRAIQQRGGYYIYFFGVKYFSGPTAWKGANLTLESTEECLHLIQTIYPRNSFSENTLAKIRYYSIYLDYTQIKIICDFVQISKIEE